MEGRNEEEERQSGRRRPADPQPGRLTLSNCDLTIVSLPRADRQHAPEQIDGVQHGVMGTQSNHRVIKLIGIGVVKLLEAKWESVA